MHLILHEGKEPSNRILRSLGSLPCSEDFTYYGVLDCSRHPSLSYEYSLKIIQQEASRSEAKCWSQALSPSKPVNTR